MRWYRSSSPSRRRGRATYLRQRTKNLLLMTAASLVTSAFATNCPAGARGDSLALFGAWKWVCSGGGYGSPGFTIPAPGCSSVVYMHRDGTYACWERDSLGDNLLCHGEFKVLGKGEWPGFPRAVSVEFDGWPGGDHQLVTLEGDNEFLTYPGGYRIGNGAVLPPLDASTSTYVRVTGESEPRITRAALKSGGKLRHEPVAMTPEGEMLRPSGIRPRPAR